MSISQALALDRCLRDGAALLLWGSSVYLALLAPPLLRASLAAASARWVQAAVSTLVIAVLALLPCQAASIGDGWAAALDPDMIGALLSETSLGAAWLVQGAAATALALALTLPDPWRDRATAILSALLLSGLTLTGHAAMHEGWLGIAHRINTVLHLLAAGFWLGALVPLLPTLSLLRDASRREVASIALQRFSRIGHIAVILVVATGVLNIALILDRWPDDWTSLYQRLLAAKIVLVTIMTALAVLNRYGFVPRMRDTQAEAIRFATLAEVALGSAAVALVAVFGQLDPG